jgi:hypothetical protein
MGSDNQVCDTSGDFNAPFVATNLTCYICAFHDQAQFSGHLARVTGPSASSQIAQDVLHGLLVLRSSDMGWIVWLWILHRHIDKDAALVLVSVDDSIHHVKNGSELTQGRCAAMLPDHIAEGVLHPAILHLQGGQHKIFLARKMLVKSGLTDPYIGQYLFQADVTKAVAVKTPHCCLGQSPSRC